MFTVEYWNDGYCEWRVAGIFKHRNVAEGWADYYTTQTGQKTRIM
jgi:hypothetical protein